MPQDDAICRSSRRRRQSAAKSTVPHLPPPSSSSLEEADDSLSPASSSAVGGEAPLMTHRCRRRRPSSGDRQVSALASRQLSAMEYISCSNSSQAVSQSRSPASGLEPMQSASNGSSDEEDDEPDSLPDNVARATEMELKKQLIFADGKLKTICVQAWPCSHRIPVQQRHRLQDPMRQHYGKLSQRVRLQKEFEARRMHREHNVMPLLPRRMQQEARSRLLRWYVPLNLKVTQHGIRTFCASQG